MRTRTEQTVVSDGQGNVIAIEEYEVPIEVPQLIRIWQARAALRQAGLLDAVNAAVVALGGPVGDIWEYGVDISRTSPWVEQLGQQLGLTDDQIDDLFIAANAIEL